MISLLQLIILALIQGLTEFLPVSSSAHLEFMPLVFKWQDQGLLLDIAVHFGTLLAVMLYFGQDTLSMIKGGFDTVRFRESPQRKFFLQLCVATIPVVITGATMGYLFENGLRLIEIIGWASIAFGILLYLADRYSPMKYAIGEMTFTKAFLAGLGQSIAVIPGTSRAGISMTTLRALGFNRLESAHFSCLMSIPAIIAASAWMGYKLIKANQVELYFNVLIAIILSFLAGYLSIAFMMHWLKRSTYTIFVIYRICLGAFLLTWFYWL